MEKTSEEMYKYVESKVKECFEIYKSHPVTDDMVKNFNEIADKLNDMDNNVKVIIGGFTYNGENLEWTITCIPLDSDDI